MTAERFSTFITLLDPRIRVAGVHKPTVPSEDEILKLWPLLSKEGVTHLQRALYGSSLVRDTVYDAHQIDKKPNSLSLISYNQSYVELALASQLTSELLHELTKIDWFKASGALDPSLNSWVGKRAGSKSPTEPGQPQERPYTSPCMIWRAPQAEAPLTTQQR